MYYVPHGDYPKGQGTFNVLKMFPELFKDINFQDFSFAIGRRFIDFISAGMFLYASQYQSNYGAKLVMLLSAVERTNGTWKSLETVLKRKETRKQLKACKNGVEATKLLDTEIETYLNNFGSTRSVVKFYQDNLTPEQKQRLINGINYSHTYKKQAFKNGILFTPVRLPRKAFDNKEDELNDELARRLKQVVYSIRNNFVHNASYIPFPDKKYISDRRLFFYEYFVGNEPKEQWIITLPFETLHELTLLAFIEYWRKQY